MWDWQYSTKPSHTHIGGNVLWNIVSLTQHCYRFWIMLCKVITQNQCWSGIVFFDTIWFHFFFDNNEGRFFDIVFDAAHSHPCCSFTCPLVQHWSLLCDYLGGALIVRIGNHVLAWPWNQNPRYTRFLRPLMKLIYIHKYS